MVSRPSHGLLADFAKDVMLPNSITAKAWDAQLPLAHSNIATGDSRVKSSSDLHAMESSLRVTGSAMHVDDRVNTLVVSAFFASVHRMCMQTSEWSTTAFGRRATSSVDAAHHMVS